MHAPHAVRHRNTVHCPSCSGCRVAVLQSEITVPLIYGLRRTVLNDNGRINQTDLPVPLGKPALRTFFEEFSCLRCGLRFGLQLAHDPAATVSRIIWVPCEHL